MLPEESQNLKEESALLQEKITSVEEQLKEVITVCKQQEILIREMEKSRFWKMKLLCNRIRKTPAQAKKEARTYKMSLLRYFFSVYFKIKIRNFLTVLFKHIYLILELKKIKILSDNNLDAHERSGFSDPYALWKYRNTPTSHMLSRYREDIKYFRANPLVSILMPVYNTPVEFLKASVDSVMAQVYDHWELCIADDHSDDKAVIGYLKELEKRDNRIKISYRKETGHISECSNTALRMASGEYVALLDHDDLISEDALYEVVRLINNRPDADFIYSDEDKLSPEGKFEDPYFKPGWSPDTLLSRNYITHFSVIRKKLVDQVGGFRQGFEGSQDYDLFLRITELTGNIFHIPKILYHWRIHESSSASSSFSKFYAYDAAVRSLTEAMERRGIKSTVKPAESMPGYYNIRYTVTEFKKVSIVIPTKDNVSMLEKCLRSVFELTDYPDFEVLVVSNNSTKSEIFTLLKQYSEKYKDRFSWYENNILFNFSKLMNDAEKKCSGEYLLFLNDDTEVITTDWLTEMVGYAQQDRIGAVGVKLLYANDTIQHAGVVVGLGGIAGHLLSGVHKDDGRFRPVSDFVNNYSAVTAACMMCRRNVFLESGGFDENLEIEFNDVDFCLKLIDKNYNNVFLPHVTLYHHESISRGKGYLTPESLAMHKNAEDIFSARWQTFVDNDPFYNINLTRKYSTLDINV